MIGMHWRPITDRGLRRFGFVSRPPGDEKKPAPASAPPITQADKPGAQSANRGNDTAPLDDSERKTKAYTPSEAADWLCLTSSAYRAIEGRADATPNEPTANTEPVAENAGSVKVEQARDLPSQIGGYEIIGELGHGGMGVVYKAMQIQLNRPVALKMIHAKAIANLDDRVRFLAEAETVAKLRHPNIVQIFEIGLHEKQPFIALEFIDGGSLADQLRRTPQSPRAAARLAEILARTIHHVHQQGVVHCDLKPANILMHVAEGRLPSDGSGVRAAGSAGSGKWKSAVPKITDFGLAKHLGVSEGLVGSDEVMGTPHYMAPEQAQGHAELIGPATDIYALGAILYELLTGRPPFMADHPKEVMLQAITMEPPSVRRLQPQTPLDVATICMKCLEKQPKDRYATAGELAEDLRRFLEGEPIMARPVGRLERLGKWVKRRRKLVGLSTVVALLAGAGAGAAAYFAWTAIVARDLASKNEERAAKAEQRAHMSEAMMLFQRGLTLAEQGDADRGLHWMLAALRQAPADAVEFQRMVRTNLAAWSEAAPVGRAVAQDEVLPGTWTEPTAVSTDRRWQAKGMRDGSVQLLRIDQDPPHLEATLLHRSAIRVVAFDPASDCLAIGCADGTIRFWDVATHDPMSQPLKTRGPVTAMGFTPDGGQLVTVSAAGHQRWPAPATISGDLDSLSRRIQLKTGLQMGDAGNLMPITSDERERIRRQEESQKHK
jgi:hypothetical protein